MSETALPESWTDARKIILANAPWILLLVAIERAFEGHYIQAAVAFLLCIISLGIAIYWKAFEGLTKREGRKRLSFVLITIGAAILATGIYLLATQPLPTPDVTQDQTRLDQANDQLNAERDARSALDQQLARMRSELQATSTQRDAYQVEIQRLKQKASNSSAAPPPQPPTPSGPVNWSFGGQLIVASGGGQSAVVNGLIFQGRSEVPLHFKDAYLISGLTGHKVELKANVQQHGTYYPVTAVDVPAGASVQLDYIFDPALSVRDFFDQWGKFRFIIVYDDGTSFEHEFQEDQVRAKAQLMIPNAFGPRVTPREQK
jgi:hypothetical protein